MVFRLIIVLFFFSVGVFSQEKFVKHKISKGDNLSTIAKKYGVKTKDIEEANPNAPKVLKLNSVLLIPNKNQAVVEKPNEKKSSGKAITNNENTESEYIREVLPKETKYSIAKQYGITVATLEKQNPDIKEKLSVGHVLTIRTSKIVDQKNKLTLETKDSKAVKDINSEATAKAELAKNTSESKPEIINGIPQSEYIREVLPKETKYSIAKQYGITVAELEKQNPAIKEKLPIGYVLTIRSSKEVEQNNKPQLVTESVLETKSSQVTQENNVDGNQKPALVEKTSVTQPVVTDGKTQSEYIRQVLPKETKYSIAKQYGITVAELEKQNPNIKKKLPLGTILTIRTSKAVDPVKQPEVIVESQKDNFPAVAKDSTTFRFTHNSELIDQLIVNATDNIGTRYRSGGTSKAGFDCSGLMICTFNNFDIKLPRSSIEQSRIGTKIGSEEAQKGDLIFFKTNGRRQINHVGMVVEVVDGEIKFVHSSTHGGVMISSTKEPYYQRSFSQVNRVLQ